MTDDQAAICVLLIATASLRKRADRSKTKAALTLRIVGSAVSADFDCEMDSRINLIAAGKLVGDLTGGDRENVALFELHRCSLSDCSSHGWILYLGCLSMIHRLLRRRRNSSWLLVFSISFGNRLSTAGWNTFCCARFVLTKRLHIRSPCSSKFVMIAHDAKT